ncbi:MAG: TonB-dependent receptor [Alphaproteobacteria bacterium]|nr:TonB-dependent receptor [Alphaproteobacteria bacterium]
MLLLLLVAASLADDEPEVPPEVAEEVDEVVEVQSASRSALPCRTALDRAALEALPARRPEEQPRAIPGFAVTNHLGHGSWNWSWHGFDAGHGRELETRVEGVPLNVSGHILGDGTADLAFLPRIVVDRIELCPTASRPGAGAWSTAGSLGYRVAMPHAGWLARVTTGTDGSGEIIVGWSPPRRTRETFVLFEADDGLGVGPDRRWRHLRLIGGVQGTLGELQASLLVALHDGAWDVPPEPRSRDLADEVLGFRESYRLWSGAAESRRLLVTGRVARLWLWGGLDVHAWVTATGTGLADNRTGFLDHPDQGDGTRTFQTTLDTGVRASLTGRRPWLSDEATFQGGVEVRGTSSEQDRTRVDLERQPGRVLFERSVGRTGIAAWGRARVGFFQRAAVEAGMHLAYDRLALRPDEDAATAIGEAFTWSPRATVVGTPIDGWTLHATYARAYRPPDPRRLLEPAGSGATVVDGLEARTVIDPVDLFALTLTAHGAWAEQEVVVDRLDDRVLSTAPTQRAGFEAALALRPFPGVRLQLEAAFADARRRDDGTLLPYVARTWFSVGLHADDRAVGPVRLTGSLRLEAIPRRPLPDGFTTGNIVALDLLARLRWKRWAFELAVDNLAPWDWTSEEFVHVSRWDPRAPVSPLPERHVVAGRPFALRLGVEVRL